MNTIKIQTKKSAPAELNGFWEQGFRPFFFAAIIFSFISILYWAFIYSNTISPPITKMGLTIWHAHQMIFGYAMAVIAGFLLTAVPNWTGTASNGGIKLLSVFSLWTAARLLFLAGDNFLLYAGLFDVAFCLLLFAYVAYPIIKQKNWGQSGILAKILILLISNVCFYLSTLEIIGDISRSAIYSGFFIIIGLILTISGRVFPNFTRIATGIDYIKTEQKVQRMLALFVFLLFYINEVFIGADTASSLLCLLLFLIYGKRVLSWHNKAIWSKPLIWSLYLSVTFIVFSFLLIGLNLIFNVHKLFAIHSMAIGGIGLATAGFMVRVCLGHSGKNIHHPPSQTRTVLILLLISVFFRVLMPVFSMNNYMNWILLSQICWVIAFFVLLFVCFEKDHSQLSG